MDVYSNDYPWGQYEISAKAYNKFMRSTHLDKNQTHLLNDLIIKKKNLAVAVCVQTQLNCKN